jgi:predicted amidohydrolase
MQDLKIALLQFDQVWENRLANWQKIETFLKTLQSSEVLILPEMFDTGELTTLLFVFFVKYLLNIT